MGVSTICRDVTNEMNDDLYKLQGCSEKVVIQRAARG